MEEHTTEQVNPDTIGEVRICLGHVTDLTLGSGGGSSEDKRYVYN